MNTIVKVICWVVIAFGAYVCFMPLLGCSNDPVVGTAPYAEEEREAITWDDDLGEALCALGYCGTRIVLHTNEPIPTGATLIYKRVGVGPVWNCNPAEEIHCYGFWNGYAWETYCDMGNCAPTKMGD